MRFKYKGYSEESGSIEAKNYSVAWEILRSRDLKITDLSEEKFAVGKFFSDRFNLFVSGGDFFRAIFFKELSVLSAVMNLNESLAIMKKSAENAFAEKILSGLIKELERGENLAGALKK